MSANSPTNADDVLRRYLLGTLPPESRESVEQRLFSEDEVFWERLSLAEEQLIDDGAWNRLNAADEEPFEHNFLTTGERRAKLEFARALRSYVVRMKEESQVAQPAAPNPVWQWLRDPVAAPRWVMAAAAALLLAVLPGLTWYFAASPEPGGLVVAASLTSGQLRDINQDLLRIPIGPDCQMVRLGLEIGSPTYDSYSATLFDVTGDEVEIWSQQRLTAGTGQSDVMLSLPCGLLPAGDYAVRLSGVSPGADPVPLGRYPFRVPPR